MEEDGRRWADGPRLVRALADRCLHEAAQSKYVTAKQGTGLARVYVTLGKPGDELEHTYY